MKRRSVAAILGVAFAFALTGLNGGVSDDAFKELSVDDQVEFVRKMNAMLQDFKTVEEKSRVDTAYRLNRDFIKYARTVDRRRVLAEVFATAPEFVLPTLADGLASDFFNRRSALFAKADDAFENFVISAMFAVYRRCRGPHDLDISNQRRLAFAVIMFLKASEGKPSNFLDQLIPFVPDVVREVAQKEWIPSALGADGKKPTYEPILLANTNDQQAAEREMPITNDRMRMTLKFPAPEHALTTAQNLHELEGSALLLAPKFESDIEPIIPVKGQFGDLPTYDGQPL